MASVRQGGSWSFPKPDYRLSVAWGLVLYLVVLMVFCIFYETYPHLLATLVATFVGLLSGWLSGYISFRVLDSSIYWVQDGQGWVTDNKLPQGPKGWVFKVPVSGRWNRFEVWWGGENNLWTAELIKRGERSTVVFSGSGGHGWYYYQRQFLEQLNVPNAVLNVLQSIAKMPPSACRFRAINNGRQILVEATSGNETHSHVFSDGWLFLEFLQGGFPGELSFWGLSDLEVRWASWLEKRAEVVRVASLVRQVVGLEPIPASHHHQALLEIFVALDLVWQTGRGVALVSEPLETAPDQVVAALKQMVADRAATDQVIESLYSLLKFAREYGRPNNATRDLEARVSRLLDVHLPPADPRRAEWKIAPQAA